MLIIIAVLSFIVVFIVLYSVLLGSGELSEGETCLEGAEYSVAMQYVDEEMKKPLYQRLFQPLMKGIGYYLLRMTPQAIRTMFAEKIVAAGGFFGMGTGEYLALWSSIAGLVAGVLWLFGSTLQMQNNKVQGLSIFGFAFVLLLAILVLNYRIASRREAIEKSLPDVLDILCISVQAGLSFDSALAKIVEKMKGPFKNECVRMLQEIEIGVPRRSALKRLSQRCGVRDVSLFMGAVAQAEQLGVSIANVLEVQAKSVREKRRQKVKEAAMKVPVKMLFPLVFFIFPALFVVLLAPSIINIINMLAQR